jgi:chaperonin GroES
MDPSQVQPLGDRLLVKSIKEEQVGSVIIPEISQGRPEKATVLAVGPGNRDPKTGERIPLEIEVGDIVIFHRHAGTHIGGLSDDFIVFREQDILARILDPDLSASA